MKRLVIGASAKRDLADIAAFTERTWGARRKHKYLDLIRRRMAAIRANPAIGVVRHDVRAAYRSLPGGRHQIFYRDTEDAVIVLRILHDSMDVHRHLEVIGDRPQLN